MIRDSLPKKRALYTINSMIVQRFFRALPHRHFQSPLPPACMRGLLQSLHRRAARMPLTTASAAMPRPFDTRHMQVTIKTPAEQEQMRVAGRLAADVLDMIGPHVVPGVTTDELNARCHEYIVNVQQAIPAPLNYRGFPEVDLHLGEPRRLSRHSRPTSASSRATSSMSTSPSSKMAGTATPAACTPSARSHRPRSA